ncbi:hypothetical protein B0H19DRAFT_1253758 [Mycena capillaripes]|nr:hypothetical protein B0H19DRAFT_1253758 [Mycena capillaripes]
MSSNKNSSSSSLVFIFAAEAAQLDGYLLEMAAPPSAPVPVDPSNLTTEDTNSIARYPGVVRLRKANEAIVKQALASTIPHSLFLEGKGKLQLGDLLTILKFVSQTPLSEKEFEF